jgi:hypothetical protein
MRRQAWAAAHTAGVWPAAADNMLYVVLHELSHALGFTAGSLALFR